MSLLRSELLASRQLVYASQAERVFGGLQAYKMAKIELHGRIADRPETIRTDDTSG